MEGDGSKPDNKLPPAFRPGAQPVEGMVHIVRDGVEWEVLGTDAEGARLFARTVNGVATGWIECRGAEPILEMHSYEPVDVVCTCTRFPKSDGFAYSPELDLWVHGPCGKPKRLYLDNMIKRLEKERGEGFLL